MSKARILIVDDEEATRELFAELLQRWGYEVDQTADGHGALKLAAGLSAPDRLQDLADVLSLVRANGLPESFAETLDSSVREKYRELWAAAQRVNDR